MGFPDDDDDGSRRLIYEFDTAEADFVPVKANVVPLDVSQDGADNVLVPIPPEFADRCLA